MWMLIIQNSEQQAFTTVTSLFIRGAHVTGRGRNNQVPARTYCERIICFGIIAKETHPHNGSMTPARYLWKRMVGGIITCLC